MGKSLGDLYKEEGRDFLKLAKMQREAEEKIRRSQLHLEEQEAQAGLRLEAKKIYNAKLNFTIKNQQEIDRARLVNRLDREKLRTFAEEQSARAALINKFFALLNSQIDTEKARHQQLEAAGRLLVVDDWEKSILPTLQTLQREFFKPHKHQRLSPSDISFLLSKALRVADLKIATDSIEQLLSLVAPVNLPAIVNAPYAYRQSSRHRPVSISPLALAIDMGNKRAVEILLAAGANVQQGSPARGRDSALPPQLPVQVAKDAFARSGGNNKDRQEIVEIILKKMPRYRNNPYNFTAGELISQ